MLAGKSLAIFSISEGQLQEDTRANERMVLDRTSGARQLRGLYAERVIRKWPESWRKSVVGRSGKGFKRVPFSPECATCR